MKRRLHDLWSDTITISDCDWRITCHLLCLWRPSSLSERRSATTPFCFSVLYAVSTASRQSLAVVGIACQKTSSPTTARDCRYAVDLPFTHKIKWDSPLNLNEYMLLWKCYVDNRSILDLSALYHTVSLTRSPGKVHQRSLISQC